MIKTSFFFTLGVLYSFSSYASAPNKDFDKWVNYFTQEARLHNITEDTLSTFKEKATYLPQVIKFDRNQPHATTSFRSYLDKIVPQSRADKAKKKIAKHWKILEEVEKKFGVQKRFIVALWAIESNFGTNMGSFNIPSALATLSYEGRRAELFKKELLHALTIIDHKHISYDSMKGSWAGAMGQTQFMPSSFLDYAIDYNGNQKTNIWEEPEDVFASIANFLSKKGWDSKFTWGREVKIPTDLDKKLIGKETTKKLSEWDQLGIRKASGAQLSLTHDINASLVEVNKEHYFLIYDNYKTLLKWNRSLYFASAVGILADKINR